MQTLKKLKLTTIPKLTCTQCTWSLKKVGWKDNDSKSKVKEWNIKNWNQSLENWRTPKLLNGLKCESKLKTMEE
jgi:hypothetical protein